MVARSGERISNMGPPPLGRISSRPNIRALHPDADAVPLLRKLNCVTIGDNSVVIVEHLIDVANMSAGAMASHQQACVWSLQLASMVSSR